MVLNKLTTDIKLFKYGFSYLHEELVYIRYGLFKFSITKYAKISKKMVKKIIEELGFLEKTTNSIRFYYIEHKLLQKYKLYGIKNVKPYQTEKQPIHFRGDL